MTDSDAALPPDSAALRELFARQEAVRQQVARALHNEIGQAVSAIKMSAHLAVDEDDSAQRSDDLREIVRIADDTVARLRDLYAVLRPPQLDALGLQASLRGEAEAWHARWGLQAAVQFGFADDARPATAIELAAFRLIQDVLAPQVTLSRLLIAVDQIHDDLVLRVEHDGSVPDAATLSLLSARAGAYGGSIDASNAHAQSVQLVARLPWAGADA